MHPENPDDAVHSGVAVRADMRCGDSNVPGIPGEPSTGDKQAGLKVFCTLYCTYFMRGGV
jgi:hypothetical protein